MGNSFLILVSQYVPSDGLVGWKSSKLGANFYTPNIFTKDVKELSSRLINAADGSCKYSIDIMIIAGISIESVKLNCLELSKFVTKETCILISADFGCELEEIVSRNIGNECNCILSISCDVECRQLSSGSYALVNDDNCRVYFGITYTSKNYADDDTLLNNEVKFHKEMNDKDSSLNSMIEKLTATPWIKVKKFNDSQKMAIKMWESIIPKISLNILSIIYEQFDYDLMLQDKSIETMFKDLVRELFEICTAQCHAEVVEYLLPPGNENERINFDSIIEHCRKKKIELITSTAHEYPEYLSLPFEPYCFYHRFEYPAQILLYQPISLAKKYSVTCSNLNFLFGFYSRLLSLSGLSIKGGRIERDVTHFDQLISSSSSESIDEASRSEGKSRKKSAGKRNSDYFNFGFSMSLPTGTNQGLPKNVEAQYTNGLSVPPNTKSSQSDEYRNAEDASSDEEQNDLQDNLALTTGSMFNIAHRDICKGKTAHNRTDINRSHASFNSMQPPLTSQSILDDMGIMSAQQYEKISLQNPFCKSETSLTFNHSNSRGVYSTADSLRRPITTSGLEIQLRKGHNLIVKEYQDLQNKLYNFEISKEKESSNERRLKYAHMENKLWKFQRSLNIYNGKIPRPNTGDYEDLLDHIEILTHNSPIDVLKCTTGRYGGVDLFTSLQAGGESSSNLNLKNTRSSQQKHNNQQVNPSFHTIASFRSQKRIPSDEQLKSSSAS